MVTHVKICGITRPEDALAAAQLGVDALGLVFYAPSQRAVDIEQAKKIVAVLPPFVSVVGLFVNAEAAFINDVLANVSLDLLQFHGDETPQQCRAFSRRYYKAIRMREGVDLQQEVASYHDACAILLDTYEKGLPGGTGKTFDWQSVPATVEKPIILAGGLNPLNVTDAIRSVSPYAVDVSGGVESAKGIKDKDKMAALIHAVTALK